MCVCVSVGMCERVNPLESALVYRPHSMCFMLHKNKIKQMLVDNETSFFIRE